MKTITLDQMVQFTSDMFNHYVEPLALSLMSGEVPNTTFIIHRSDCTSSEWLAQIRFKNTLTISVFHCDIWIEDVMRFCRKCKMYLITEEVFKITVLYTMLHPLYQTQHMNFTTDVNTDYDSMMAGAAQSTYQFIQRHYHFTNTFERLVLDIVNINSMIMSNTYKYLSADNLPSVVLSDLLENYSFYMTRNHKEAYRSAKRQKAQTNLVDEDGFILLEPITKGGTAYYGKED